MKANLNVSSNQSSAKKLAEKNAKLPDCFFWDCDQVCEFFEELKLGEYKVQESAIFEIVHFGSIYILQLLISS